MCLKIWLIRKIEAVELELKYLKALLIMLEHVEKATDYPDSDDDYSIKTDYVELLREYLKNNFIQTDDDNYSIKTDDIELISESDDEENEKIKQKVLKKIKEIENKK